MMSEQQYGFVEGFMWGIAIGATIFCINKDIFRIDFSMLSHALSFFSIELTNSGSENSLYCLTNSDQLTPITALPNKSCPIAALFDVSSTLDNAVATVKNNSSNFWF